MIDFFQNYWYIIKSHLRNVIMFFIGINLMALLSFIVVCGCYINYINNPLDINVVEYNEIDREQLCKISKCIGVESHTLKKSFKPNNKGHLQKAEYVESNLFHIHKSLYYSYNNSFVLYNDKSDTFFILDTEHIILDYSNAMGIIIPLSLLIFVLPLLKSIREEKNTAMFVLAGNEALLANKSMINIAENIHHELNTPIEVIDNKIEKIHRVFKKYMIDTKDIENNPKLKVCEVCGDYKVFSIEKEKQLNKLETDFEFIKTSSEQIYSVLQKMKEFKHLRYSNGNKSIENIIDGGFQIINISNSNFSYHVDSELSKYKIGSKDLKNADLLGIILNHIKNSLEANANKIYIKYAGFEKNKLKIRIIDNGNGIPKEAQRNIFKPNFSTKSIDSGIRGNGMYLNRYILNSVSGSIRLVSSSNKGTTIELAIPVYLK